MQYWFFLIFVESWLPKTGANQAQEDNLLVSKQTLEYMKKLGSKMTCLYYCNKVLGPLLGPGPPQIPVPHNVNF